MMESSTDLDKYIPAGTFCVTRADTRISDDVWAQPFLQTWHRFAHGQDPPQPEMHAHQGRQTLPHEIQSLLLASPRIKSFAPLFEHRWIDLEFRISVDDAPLGVLRFYILPDDVDRRHVARSDPTLKKARRLLFSKLNYSAAAWNGRLGIDGSSFSGAPRPFERDDSEADESQDQGKDRVSLLHIFNNLPSPDPQPNSVTDGFAWEAMWNLLESNVVGLKTTLYSHQRKSAALMLQREARPGQVFDGRLLKVADQHGKPWYFDYVNGYGVREPRYYEDVRGGILAEQMGSGKTLICLALILATKDKPAEMPDVYRGSGGPVRPKVGLLSDMAAACITRNSVPWRLWFSTDEGAGMDHSDCISAIRRNAAFYQIRQPPPKRERRRKLVESPPSKVFLSNASLIIVPSNLVQQWKQEVTKHTTGLNMLAVTHRTGVPPVEELLQYDIILFSSSQFERLLEDGGTDVNGAFVLHSPLANIHFKRCIVDEGHKLGNSRIGNKSNLLLVLDCLHFSARWIVTGTPSRGLFGVEEPDNAASVESADGSEALKNGSLAEVSPQQEKDDLQKIGAIAKLYLGARPWANTTAEGEDASVDWATYVMQPQYASQSQGRVDCLKNTLKTLIIRHRVSEIRNHLPPVEEKTVYLEGSYQDQLALNLFSMMIIFNAVQSQRTDMDYFFHRRQRKALQELVSNLRQASFFGGSFFSPSGILKAVETAEKFLEEKKIATSTEDEALLRSAIAFGHVALANSLKEVASVFHEVPLYVSNFPGGLGEAWSLDGRDGDPVCTDSRLVMSLQKFLRPCIDAPNALQMLFDSGRLRERGQEERMRFLEEQLPPPQANGNAGTAGGGASKPATLAGNTVLGEDRSVSSRKRKSITPLTSSVTRSKEGLVIAEEQLASTVVAEPLSKTQIISTASAKLSYLIDAIVKHQEEEQIIVFYENDNVAYYLAGVLEILQIHHLIYAKSITPERRSQYVATFNHNPKFRVLLMDITQAAFGLDMRSASRIYFINPVLNPQVEAQAIGRARRISADHPHRRVCVETLVLRGSLEEVLVARRGALTLAEHHKLRSILDDRPIYDWILNARIAPMPDISAGAEDDVSPGLRETALLRTPLYVFGAGAGREAHPDEDLVAMAGLSARPQKAMNGHTTLHEQGDPASATAGTDRSNSHVVILPTNGVTVRTASPAPSLARKRKVQFASPRAGTPASATPSSRASPVPLAEQLTNVMRVEEPGAQEERPARRVRFAGPEVDE